MRLNPGHLLTASCHGGLLGHLVTTAVLAYFAFGERLLCVLPALDR
ncbi:hypothetical protein MKK50_18000 [Methylobacterium sp. J-043]|nr:hypothetical protein [Methylobacterium sp. J-043]